MGTKMNEEQYRKMIALDIEFLKQLPDTLERKHIVSILKESVEMYYSCEGDPADLKNANCAIFDVSGSLPDDVPLFVDWLDKYYTHAGNDDLYKRKDNGTIEPQRKLYKDYCRAYKLKQ